MKRFTTCVSGAYPRPFAPLCCRRHRDATCCLAIRLTYFSPDGSAVDLHADKCRSVPDVVLKGLDKFWTNISISTSASMTRSSAQRMPDLQSLGFSDPNITLMYRVCTCRPCASSPHPLLSLAPTPCPALRHSETQSHPARPPARPSPCPTATDR